ncbi:hypothetical protein EB155_02700 [archaeon]|nr:hypothetical protein [archaeon]
MILQQQYHHSNLHCLLNVYHNSELEEESNEIREYIETNNVDTDVLEKVIISYIKKLFKDEDFKLREDKTKHNNEVENNLTPFE